MTELAPYIEKLLLSNDCVIVPGLGGFVAHYTPAGWNDDEQCFRPPMRLLAFNHRLQLNDGLLVQQYMAAYGTTFPDATRRVEREVEALKELLQSEGKACLPNVGELRCSIHGVYHFHPYDNRLTTPRFYGLESFELPRLKPQAPVSRHIPASGLPDVGAMLPHPRVTRVPLPAPAPKRMRGYMRHVRRSMGIVGIILMAVLLSILPSAPIENTEVTHSNYARLVPSDWLNQLESHSLAFTTADVRYPAEVKPQNPKSGKPIVAREVKVARPAVQTSRVEAKAAPVKVQTAPRAPQATPAKPYHIIVASVGTEADARTMAARLKSQGHAGAEALIGDGKMRVSIGAYATEQEAYAAVNQLRQDPDYKQAWVLKKRK